jgi:hypothetical protein
MNAPTKVCERTALRWMKFLGFFPTEHTKGYSVDGHEREDVIAHRIEFLKFMEDLERRVCSWE